MIALAQPVDRIQSPQPKPTRIEQLQQSTSATRLICWLQCRLKFYFRYVLQIKKAQTPALYFGDVVHSVLRAWSMARWKREQFELERFKALFEKGWAEQSMQINWDGEEDDQRRTAWSVLETYFKETPIKPDERPEAVEVPVEADLSKYSLPRLIGILDLVRAGGLIVDYKTSGKTPNAEDAEHLNELQLSSYSVLYRESVGKCESGRELHHLVKLKTPKIVITSLPPMTESQRVKLFKIMESYQEGLARRDIVPSPGFHCAGCEFFNECRKWDGSINA
jgi:putative RecB family exonuclease